MSSCLAACDSTYPCMSFCKYLLKMADSFAIIEDRMHSMNGLLKYCTIWLMSHLRGLTYVALPLVCVVWLFHRVGRRVSPSGIRASTPDLEKPAARAKGSFKAVERTPGVWKPVSFQRPPAAPYPEWDIHTTNPLPYRPFRRGPYHITMGLRTMKWEEWIELDNHFLTFHADKARRINERGRKCCKTAPEAFDGAVELLEEL